MQKGHTVISGCSYREGRANVNTWVGRRMMCLGDKKEAHKQTAAQCMDEPESGRVPFMLCLIGRHSDFRWML